MNSLLLHFLSESHYQYAPPDSPHSASCYTGCEFDCCFTEQDLLIDVLLDEYSSPNDPSSSTTTTSSMKGLSFSDSFLESAMETELWPTENAEREEEEYFSLTERCLHQQLSESLGGEIETLATGQVSPQKFTSAASTLPNAFLFAAIFSIAGCLS